MKRAVRPTREQSAMRRLKRRRSFLDRDDGGVVGVLEGEVEGSTSSGFWRVEFEQTP